jgi:mannose-1-phosphate guanylyltransferase/mannose-6-phosphate isomerase
MINLQPVILCGGSGTRLWPLSREQHPKQLLALTGPQTLLQATALRIKDEPGALAPIVVANEDCRFMTAEQLRQAEVPAAIILEPARRGTAPALALAALHALDGGEDPVLLVMPADHVITGVAAFRAAAAKGAAHAAEGKIVAFGVAPTRPETGFGYIKASSAADAAEIEAFVEKPDAIKAAAYLASGRYLWNSGIFMMRASVWLRQLGVRRPEMLAACRSAFAAREPDLDFLRVGRTAFEACPSDSIDYAVMEKLDRGEGVVVSLEAGWSDIGAWGALWSMDAKDADNNLLHGDVVAVGTSNTLAFAQSRLVALVGLADIVVVETPDAVLVANKNDMRRLGEVVARLKRDKRSEANTHRKIYRPWGWYDSIDSGSRFQVKRLVVNPGASLSLQMHHHRAEHWVVVRGTAKVTSGEKTFLLSENESTYIPIGGRHRLENPGKVPVEIIEVQSGGYLGEDDIVRFEDIYGRAADAVIGDRRADRLPASGSRSRPRRTAPSRKT